MSYWKRVQKTVKVVKNVGKNTQTVDQTFGYYEKIHKPIRRKSNGGDLFEAACKIAGVQPTVRQYNKFQRGVGAAFSMKVKVESDARMREVTREIFQEVQA